MASKRAKTRVITPGRLYKTGDSKRRKAEPQRGSSKGRTEYRRDYARLIHSPSFRRLQGKTQLFPGFESDFFRNRLTHSIEVAQVAKTIAMNFNASEFADPDVHGQLDTDLVELAALAHDLGHPPFGHNGEAALDECMAGFGGFEGNAQTLRLLSVIEKKALSDDHVHPIGSDGSDHRLGLNLTYRSLAAVLKYDSPIPATRKYDGRVVKGYYETESLLVAEIKSNVLAGASAGTFKTVECQIMDIADDIAYSTYDLEDAMKGGFLDPLRILSEVSANSILRARIAAECSRALKRSVTDNDVGAALKRIFSTFIDEDSAETSAVQLYKKSQNVATNGHARTLFTAALVGHFVDAVTLTVNAKAPQLSTVNVDDDTLLEIEVLKHLSYQSIIMSPRLKIVEHRGKEIVQSLFQTFASDRGAELLPDDVRQLHSAIGKLAGPKDALKARRMRVICDYVASMTDRYAFEFYGRLQDATRSIFVPI